MLDLITPMSLFHFLPQVRHLHRMALAMMMIYLDLQGYQDTYVPDEIMPHDDLGDDPPDLGGTGGGPFGTGPGPNGQPGGQDGDLPSGRNRVPVRTWRESLPHTILDAVLPYRYQMIVTHPVSSYLMGLTVHHLTMTIPPYPMEVHMEPPPPGGPPDAPRSNTTIC